jgi:hypothetical protein
VVPQRMDILHWFPKNKNLPCPINSNHLTSLGSCLIKGLALLYYYLLQFLKKKLTLKHSNFLFFILHHSLFIIIQIKKITTK